MVITQKVMNISTNFSKFEKSQKEMVSRTATVNLSKLIGQILSERFYCRH